MLVNIASFLPIILVGPIADKVGSESVILGTSVLVLLAGIRSVLVAPPRADAVFAPSRLQPTDPVTVTTSPQRREVERPPRQEGEEQR